jgi:hypothetical protein
LRTSGLRVRPAPRASADCPPWRMLAWPRCSRHSSARSLCLSLASVGRESALATLCRTLRPTGLLNALLALLSEVLWVGSDPLVLFRAAEALASALAPLDFCGALVPIFPDGVHPEAPTLLNQAVETYIVGLHTVHHAKLKPELDDDEILTFDLDTATLRRARAAKRRSLWLRLRGGDLAAAPCTPWGAATTPCRRSAGA